MSTPVTFSLFHFTAHWHGAKIFRAHHRFFGNWQGHWHWHCQWGAHISQLINAADLWTIHSMTQWLKIAGLHWYCFLPTLTLSKIPHCSVVVAIFNPYCPAVTLFPREHGQIIHCKEMLCGGYCQDLHPKKMYTIKMKDHDCRFWKQNCHSLPFAPFFFSHILASDSD